MGSILVVDNEAVVVQIARVALEWAGHFVAVAKSGDEALRIATNMKRLDVMIVNHLIDADRGRDIVDRVLPVHPKLKVVHISCWSREYLEKEDSLSPGAVFLPKPFSAPKLQAIVASLIP